MNKFENFTSRSQYYYNKPGIVTNFSEGFNNLLLDTAKKIALSEVHKQSTTHITSALDKIREYMLQDSYVYFDWLLIYRVLWSNCLAFNNLIELEAQILENLSKRKNISAITKYNLTLAKAHMQFITGHDQKAMNILNQTNVKINDVFFYLDSITHNHNWERMGKWLRWLKPRMDMATYVEIGKISTYWLELAEKKQIFDEVLDMLKSWLPKSSYAYETALIRGGHYKTWVEYHIFNQSLPTELGRDDIKQVESFDTTLLLPLYHQSVIFLIENKNRISYKNAVRLLKKLKTYYKKIKQLEAWEKYMTTLTNRYSRLRALKEEMRKGNLIA